MKLFFSVSISIFTALLFWTGAAQAQQGHPLVGTWQGNWGPNESDRNFLTLILEWDGNRISGLANPGPGSTELQQMQLDSSTWTVTLETDLTDDAGNLIHITAEGQMDNIGSMTRTLKGTWRSANSSGDFDLERQGGA